ncbi:hypothetical protein Poli38472_011443 [Pythium oligandrum]|uniref:Metalloendopeptidase n=1 Tax=Pythium oligandrum TaxID=41045 RepID=A0A8K1CKC9_PYTOL|nr:hypothetical protein Poli38472_011443 [Pythium oligandrum]|eukprot:TMW64563.1 hypothetical protein Poli38472_011443 [Pythium oligandrum]
MIGWRGWSLLALAASAVLSAADATTIRIKVANTKDVEVDNDSSDVSLDDSADRDCQLNGFTLKHHSLHYYADKAYVACSHGRAGCYLENRMHDHASQVSCPKGDLNKRIAEHKRKEEERRRLSLAVVDENRKWKDGVVCYHYHEEYPFSPQQTSLITDAMRVYETETNVRFLPWTACTSDGLTQYCNGCIDYIDFKHPPTGRDCNSSIGVNDQGPQIMFLSDRCFEGDATLKNSYGSAMHEIGHALGLYHEHQHPQRQVMVFWDDIPQSIWSEMKVRDVSVGGDYDAESVMHYPDTYGFCYPKLCSNTVTTGCVTPGTKFCNLNDDRSKCTPIDKSLCDPVKTAAIGQRRYLSQGDLDAINELYHTAAWTRANSHIQ